MHDYLHDNGDANRDGAAGNGDRIRCFNDYGGSTILSLSVIPHPQSPIVVVGGNVAEDSLSPLVAVELWALRSGRLLARCCGTRYQISDCHASYVPESRECIVVAGGLDSTVRMWKVSDDVFLSCAEESGELSDGSQLTGCDDLDDEEELDRIRPLHTRK